RAVRQCKLLEVRQGFAHGNRDGVAAALDLAHKHGALSHGNAVVCQVLLVDPLSKSPLRFLLDKKSGYPHPDCVKNPTQIQTDQFILPRQAVSDRSERTTARHFKPLLEFHLVEEPTLQIIP